MADPVPTDKLSSVGDFLAKLTLARVLLGFGFGAGSLALYALWKTIDSWAVYVWQSQLLLALLLGGIGVIVVGAALLSLQKRVDRNAEALQAQMQERIVEAHERRADDARRMDDLHRQLMVGRSERIILTQSVMNLTEARAECERELEQIRKDVREVKQSVSGFLPPDLQPLKRDFP